MLLILIHFIEKVFNNNILLLFNHVLDILLYLFTVFLHFLTFLLKLRLQLPHLHLYIAFAPKHTVRHHLT